MGVEVQHAVLTPRALELNVTNEGGIDGTYRLLKNIMGLWLVQECRRTWERDGRAYGYDELAGLAGDQQASLLGQGCVAARRSVSISARTAIPS